MYLLLMRFRKVYEEIVQSPLTLNQISTSYLIWMVKSENQMFPSIQPWMLPQSQPETCLVCSFTWLVLLHRIEERYFTSIWIGNLLNEKWIHKLLLSKQWHQLLILDMLIIEHPSMSKSWLWDVDENSHVYEEANSPWKTDISYFGTQ